MKNEKKGAGKPAPKGDTTSTKRSNAKIARWQAAAERDGFETWSQALTAWSKGEACLTQRAPDSSKAGVLSLPESVKVENALPAVSG